MEKLFTSSFYGADSVRSPYERTHYNGLMSNAR